MALDNGTQIGPYKVTGKLGAGGMGEVYRANDSNLRRDVAVKVLPEAFAADPGRLARFEREAQLLASLNHPNIAGIYGLEEVDGSRCLILELVEGKTLAEMIEAGPLPLETGVRLAVQIAEALEGAHDKGIIHRDLKPANIKVTPEGTVKVLDFGLAKAFVDEGNDPAPDLAHSPTLTMAATQAGMIMGTAAYMSPEQAAGQSADRRADVWSFGVVLIEMLTGRQSFAGETVSHTLASVLKDDPEWERLPKDLPPRLRELLESCLQKKVRQRLQAIGDARIVLEAWLADPAAFETPVAGLADAAAVQPAARPARAPWIVAGMLAAALVATAAFLWPSAPAPEATIRTHLALPDGQSLFRGYGTSVLLSPDGSRLAYVVSAGQQERSLFVRSLDQWDGILLADEQAPYNPFFSPDGEWVGFVTREEMFKVPIRGGSPFKLTDVSLNRGASWGDDGFIVYSPSPSSGLYRVSENGGDSELLTEIDEAESHRWPQVLPGARAVLFTALGGTETADFDDATIEVLLLESGERHVVHQGGTYGRYVASGHLVFANGTSLFAATFDLDTLRVTGPIVPVVEGVSISNGQGGAQFDVSSKGQLVFAAGAGNNVGLEVVRVTRDGTLLQLSDDPRNYANPAPSPNGKYLAVDVTDEGKPDVWVYDLERSVPTRVTSGVGANWGPIWSPDGQWIFYAVAGSGKSSIERISSDGSGRPEVILQADVIVRPTALSPDGKRLLYVRGALGKPDIYSYWMDSGESEPLVVTDSVSYDARFSPDGRWIAYGSDESGTFEVFIVPAEGGRGRWQVSNGGVYPRWSVDGKSLFYRSIVDSRVYEVVLNAGEGTIRAGRPQPVTPDEPFYFDNGPSNHFAVFGDGQSFILMRDPEVASVAHEHVNLVVGWYDALRAVTDMK
jgi:serine/threonine-protein kinase